MRCRLYAASARCWAATVTWDWARVSVGEMCNEVHGEILEEGIFSYQSTNTANNVSINKKIKNQTHINGSYTGIKGILGEVALFQSIERQWIAC